MVLMYIRYVYACLHQESFEIGIPSDFIVRSINQQTIKDGVTVVGIKAVGEFTTNNILLPIARGIKSILVNFFALRLPKLMLQNDQNQISKMEKGLNEINKRVKEYRFSHLGKDGLAYRNVEYKNAVDLVNEQNKAYQDINTKKQQYYIKESAIEKIKFGYYYISLFL